jgi:hypothetical protein
MGSYYFDYYIYLSIKTSIKLAPLTYEISNQIIKEFLKIKEIKDLF